MIDNEEMEPSDWNNNLDQKNNELRLMKLDVGTQTNELNISLFFYIISYMGVNLTLF